MIHPSYYELMEKMNENDRDEDVPEITSRYSIVLATSKRARELTDGAEPKVAIKSPKLLSVAVEEFYEGAVRLVSEDYLKKKEAERMLSVEGADAFAPEPGESGEDGPGGLADEAAYEASDNSAEEAGAEEEPAGESDGASEDENAGEPKEEPSEEDAEA